MRRTLAGPPAVAAVTLMLGLAGCGGSAGHTSTAGTTRTSTTGTRTSTTGTRTSTTSTAPTPPPHGRLTAAPAVGHPGTTVRFSLTASRTSGRHGRVQFSYALTVGGPAATGCVARYVSAVAVARAGQAVAVPVGPAQLHGRWCAGSYTARVEELARPVCAPNEACPQFIRVVAVLGPVRFRITS